MDKMVYNKWPVLLVNTLIFCTAFPAWLAPWLYRANKLYPCRGVSHGVQVPLTVQRQVQPKENPTAASCTL